MDSRACNGPSRHDARSTRELAQKLLDDAKIPKAGDQVATSALMPGRQILDEARKAGSDGRGLAYVRDKLALEAIEHALRHYTVNGGAQAAALGGAALGGSAIVGTLKMFNAYIVKAGEDGDMLRHASCNDAVNIALTLKLGFHEDFRSIHNEGRRASMGRAFEIMQLLDGPCAEMKPILRARADNGMRAALEAFGAVQARPAPERSEALVAELQKRGFDAALKDDVAFGMGVRYVEWMKTALPPAAQKREIEAMRSRDARNQGCAPKRM